MSQVTYPGFPRIGLKRELKRALETIQVRVLDHFIIGAGMPTSFAARGLL